MKTISINDPTTEYRIVIPVKRIVCVRKSEDGQRTEITVENGMYGQTIITDDSINTIEARINMAKD